MTAPDDMNERMIALCLEGHSGSVIARILAEEFGVTVTRNTVIGRLHRRGHSCAGSVRTVRLKAPSARPDGKPLPPMDLPAPPPNEPDPVLMDGLPVTMLTVRHRGMCKWAHGDIGTPEFRLCGHPTEGDESWCAFHRAIVWNLGHAKKIYAAASARAAANRGRRRFAEEW